MESGDTVNKTLRKEFLEEAMSSSLAADPKAAETMLDELFDTPHVIAETYSNDPRNTDNAWVETTAVLFHDSDGHGVGRFKLTAGDDATHVRWMTVHQGMRLYASHVNFMEDVTSLLDASW